MGVKFYHVITIYIYIYIFIYILYVLYILYTYHIYIYIYIRIKKIRQKKYKNCRQELGPEFIQNWIMRKRNLVPQRFTKEFILESIKFILYKFMQKRNESGFSSTLCLQFGINNNSGSIFYKIEVRQLH